MKNNCYIENSFFIDIGFDKIRAHLAKSTRCEENIQHFKELSPIINKNNLEIQFNYSDELINSLIRKENLTDVKLKNITVPLKSLTIKDEVIELEMFVEIRAMIQYFDSIKRKTKGNNFKEWYTNDYQSFVEYNIKDVELVDALEDKMKLLELCLTMAYEAKVNYIDVFSQVRMWDVTIYNYLRSKNIVVPQRDTRV